MLIIDSPLAISDISLLSKVFRFHFGATMINMGRMRGNTTKRRRFILAKWNERFYLNWVIFFSGRKRNTSKKYSINSLCPKCSLNYLEQEDRTIGA